MLHQFLLYTLIKWQENKYASKNSNIYEVNLNENLT